MSTVDGKLPNGGQPDQETTLEDLLNDDSFGVDSFTTAYDGFDGPKYCECLTTFVEGNSEECMEKLHNYGFLEPHLLQGSSELLGLFLGAFEAITSFSTLSVGTQRSITRSLEGTSDDIWNYSGDIPIKPRILLVTQYCKCCAKLFSTDPIKYSDNGRSLEFSMRTAIIQFSSKLPEDADKGMISRLQQAVETYLFDIQVGLLQRASSVSLYQKLCADSTSLSSCFQNTIDTHSGKPIEELITGRLEPKQQIKTKNPRHGRQSHHAHPRTISTASPVSPRASDASLLAAPRTQVGQNKQNTRSKQLEAVSKWTYRWLRYSNKIHFSRQTALVVILLLLISTKNLKKFAALPVYFSGAYRRLLPHLSNVLRLLSSI